MNETDDHVEISVQGCWKSKPEGQAQNLTVTVHQGYHEA